jgi:hypothetical protein
VFGAFLRAPLQLGTPVATKENDVALLDEENEK